MPGEGFRIASAYVDVEPNLEGFVEKLRAAIDAAGGNVNVGLEDGAVLAGLADIKAVLESIHDVTIGVEANTRVANEQLDYIADKADKLDGKDVNIDVDVRGFADAIAKLAILKAAADAAGGGGGGGGGGGAPGGGGGFNIPGLAYGIGAAAAVAPVAIPTLATSLTGLLGTGAAGGLGFLGVHQAISDYMTMQGGQTAQQAAQAAIAQISAAQQIASAQNSVITAQQQVATSAHAVLLAQQQVTASDHAYTDALFAEQQAQVNLTNARIQARLQLQQLNNAEIDGKLAVRAAQLALEQAQLNQQQTDANGLSTQLQREQAALAVAEAERQLIEAKQSEVNATAAATRADKLGVSGNQQVVSAKHTLSDATYGVVAARQAEANASYNVRAAQQAEGNATRQLALAQQSLAAAQKQAALQTAASGSAASLFAQDMAALTGPQRALVRQFESFNGVLTRLEAISGKAILPGVTVFMRGLHSILPEVATAMAKFGGVFSGIMKTIGQGLSSPAFHKQFMEIVNASVGFMNALAPLDGFFKSLFAAMAKSGPAVTGFAKGIVAIANGFAAMFKAGEPGLAGFGSILETFGKAIGDLGKPLGQISAAFAQALAPALAALLPAWKQLAGAIGQSLATVIKALAPSLLLVAKAITEIVIANAPLLPAMAQLVAALAQALVPTLQASMPLIRLLAVGMAFMAQQAALAVPVLTDVITWIGDLLGWFEKLWTGLITTGKIFGQTFSSTETTGTQFRHFMSDLWNGILGVAKAFWGGLQLQFSQGVAALRRVWGGLEAIFKAPVNFLIGTVYDKGIVPFWNDVVSHIGLSSIKLPNVPTLASGGRIPGFGGGDQHPALLEGGETVVSKEHSAALAPLFKMMGVPGYAGGGLVGSIFGGIGSFFSKAFDIGKMAAALASGDGTALSNAFADLIGKSSSHMPARGDLFRVMTAIPRTLVGDAIKAALGLVHGGGGTGRGFGTPGHPSGSVASWFAQAIKDTGVPAWWLGDLETIGYYESGWNPNAQNNWDSNAAAGDPSRGIMQTIMGTFNAYHAAGTSWNIFDPIANIAAAIRYIQARYNSVADVPGIVSLSRGGPYVGYAGGGFMPPGSVGMVGERGPELIQAGRSGATVTPVGGGAMVINQYFCSHPTVEEKAHWKREMALTLGGV